MTRAVRLVGVAVAVLTLVAELARVWVDTGDPGRRLWYAGLGAVYLALVALVVLRPPRRTWRAHVVLVVQCALVLTMLSLNGGLDYMTTLFVPLAFEAALVFRGRAAWWWVGGLAVLTIASLVREFGPARAVALGLVPLAAEVVFAAYVVALRDIEEARVQSQALLDGLQAARARLQAHAAQAGELAGLGERDRVASELNESAARTIRGVLAAAAEARALIAAGDPGGRAAGLVASLQGDTQGALAQMRGLIAELRPGAGSKPPET